MNSTSYINTTRPGVNKGQAILTGTQGTLIKCAFLVGSGTASG